jgi:hypothetical protein
MAAGRPASSRDCSYPHEHRARRESLARQRFGSPVSTNNGFADLRRIGSLFRHAIGKEDLLDADISAGAMIRCEAVEQAAVTHTVAMAVTRLLSQHHRYTPRCAIHLGYGRRITENISRKHLRQGLSGDDISMKRRNRRRFHFGRRGGRGFSGGRTRGLRAGASGPNERRHQCGCQSLKNAAHVLRLRNLQRRTMVLCSNPVNRVSHRRGSCNTQFQVLFSWKIQER